MKRESFLLPHFPQQPESHSCKLLRGQRWTDGASENAWDVILPSHSTWGVLGGEANGVLEFGTLSLFFPKIILCLRCEEGRGGFLCKTDRITEAASFVLF